VHDGQRSSHQCGARSAPGRRGAAATLAALCIAASPEARADDAVTSDADAAAVTLRVDVTGSNIKRIEGETALPVQVITRDELARGGVQTAQELLARISANQSFGGSNEASGIGSTVTGFTAASLRGLGAERTLVLLDGRRLAPYALSGGASVDLSAIPASAIERVEILKDGASAVYGTDAIGGVINFILRKDYAGAEVDASDYVTEAGGGGNGRVSVTAGTGSLARDRYNVFVSADHFRQQSLPSSARASTRTAYRPDLGIDFTSIASYPANISQSNPFTGEIYGFAGTRNPTIPFPSGATAASCALPYSFPTLALPFSCNYDYASQSDAIPATEKTTVVGRFTWQAGASARLFAEAAYYHGSITESLSATPVTSSFASATPIVLPPTSPYYPAAFVAGLPDGDPATPLLFAYRTIELGPRVDRVDVDQWNAIAGATGTLGAWDYTVAAQYTANREVSELQSGWLSAARFTPLLASGIVDLFAPNTPDVIAQMRAAEVNGEADDSRADNWGADARVSGNVLDLPAGPLAVAFGVEGRRESLRQSNSDFIENGDVVGGPGTVPSLAPTSRTVLALFGEVSVPLSRTLEADLAVRYDHYSDFGGTTNPKLSLRWQPSPAWLLRAAFGSGFRAPTLSDLFQPSSQALGGGYDFYADPVRCPVTGAARDCSGFVPLRIGGNPALQPETSRQLNAGLVVEPLTGLSASVDYYRVVLDNVIDVVALDAIYGDFAHWAPGYVVRAPPDAAHPDLPGPIDHVVQFPTNVGSVRTSGLDLGLRWRGPATPLGRFELALDGTYVIDYQHSAYVSEDVPHGAGTRGILGVIARYRQYAALDWSRGGWGATLANTYQSGYAEPDYARCDDAGYCANQRRAGSYSVWDLQWRYSGWPNTTLRLGVQNLFDRAPPATNQAATFQVGIDPSYADPRGRTYYVAIRCAFR
jgi:iron complex outermembrane receptor protein